MKGEKELIEKILNTEINIFLAIRDGSELMQHMEDFYYITLLEVLAFSIHILPFWTMLLELFKNVDKCMSNLPKVVHPRRVQDMFGESEQT